MGFGVAVHTLSMKRLAQIDSILLGVAVGASDFGITLFKIAFIQDILTILILMMTIRTGKITGHMKFMRKRDGRALLCIVGFPMVDQNLLRLSDQERHCQDRQYRGHEKHEPGLFHVLLSFRTRNLPWSQGSSFPLEPALLGFCLAVLGINALGSTDTSCQRDHSGDVDPYRAIAASAQNAVFPDDVLDALQEFSINFTPFLVQLTQ
jgi:hypothetical protein